MRPVASVAIVAASTAIGCSILYWYTRKKRQRNEPAKGKWIRIGRLQEINMFPVKSCREVSLTEAECDAEGLFYRGFINRRLLPIRSSTDQMGFAGAYPSMLSIQSEIVAADRIRLTAPDLPDLMVDLKDLQADETVRIMQKKGYRMHVREAKPEHHQWFSRAILKQDEGFKLFIVLKIEKVSKWWRSEISDFNPIMVLHGQSVEDLNSRLTPKNRVNHLQFRGNLLIDSEVPPYDEDKWQWLRIGENADTAVILQYNAPCLRCILPNVNVNTLQRNSDFEPLRTLRTYRLRQNPKEPEMGVYFDVYHKGLVRQGDPVYVQYKT